MIGSVIRIIADKGYGFIRGEDKLEYFFHRSGVKHGLWDTMQVNDRVSFEAVPNSPRGHRAEDVEVVQ